MTSSSEAGDCQIALGLHRAGVADGAVSLKADPRGGANHLLLGGFVGGGVAPRTSDSGAWRFVEAGGAAGALPAFLALVHPGTCAARAACPRRLAGGAGAAAGRGATRRVSTRGSRPCASRCGSLTPRRP